MLSDLARIVFIVLCIAFGATLAAWAFHVLLSLVFALPDWVAHDGNWAGWVIFSAGAVLGFVVRSLLVTLSDG